MLNIEQKRQIFIKLRKENYQASLRLEGFHTPQSAPVKKAVAPTLAELKAKHVR
ncbi:MAG: YhfG family protein [Pseudomonadota bacterium]